MAKPKHRPATKIPNGFGTAEAIVLNDDNQPSRPFLSVSYGPYSGILLSFQNTSLEQACAALIPILGIADSLGMPIILGEKTTGIAESGAVHALAQGFLYAFNDDRDKSGALAKELGFTPGAGPLSLAMAEAMK